MLPPTAVQYLVLPPVEVPRLSRRAGESGVVWLRVVVDVHGTPAQVQLQRSSGHARLDEQALWAMRQARFKPHTENGIPIELEVTAPSNTHWSESRMETTTPPWAWPTCWRRATPSARPCWPPWC